MILGLRRTALIEVDRQAWLSLETNDPTAHERTVSCVSGLSLPMPRFRIIDRLPVDRRHNAKIDHASLRRMAR